MKKYLLIASLANASYAQANWFTELFESAEARAIREHRSKYAICPDPYPCAYHQEMKAWWDKELHEEAVTLRKVAADLYEEADSIDSK